MIIGPLNIDNLEKADYGWRHNFSLFIKSIC